MSDNNQHKSPQYIPQPSRILPNTDRGLQPAKNPPPMPKVTPPKVEKKS